MQRAIIVKNIFKLNIYKTGCKKNSDDNLNKESNSLCSLQ